MLAAFARPHRALAFLAGTIASLTAGCGSEDESTAPQTTCASDHRVGDTCIGIPATPLCTADVCTDGAMCASVTEVRNASELAPALSGATPGSCIALHPGAYGAIVLPGSVSLLGRGADFVSVQQITLGAGAGAVIRGINVGAGGIELDGATGIRIDASRIAGATSDGIRLDKHASVDISSSEILDAAVYGVRAFDAGDLSITRSIVARSKGPGVWAQCANGCDCAARPNVSLDHVIVRDSKVIGVSLVGTAAKLSDVRISDNSVTNDFMPSGGMAASGCADLQAERLEIADNSHYGLLLDHANATIGGEGANDGFSVERSRFGVWIQNGDAQQSVKLTNGVLTGNRGVGIGMSGSTHGIIINYFQIRKTQFEAMPVISAGKTAGSQFVCDAVSWQDGVQAKVDGLTLDGNHVPEATPNPNVPPPTARASLLINGSVAQGSSLAHVTLEDGDETKPFAQQNLPPGGLSPSIGAGVPKLTQTPTELFAIPAAPATPEAK